MNQNFSRLLITISDILIVLISFLLANYLKPEGDITNYLKNYAFSLTLFHVIWLILSLLFNKFHISKDQPYHKFLLKIFQSNLLILGIALILMYGVRYLEISRFLVFGTVIIATGIEVIISFIIYTIKTTKEIELAESEILKFKSTTYTPTQIEITETGKQVPEHTYNYIIEESSEKVFNLIKKYFDLTSKENTILSTTTRFNVLKLDQNSLRGIANLKRINDIRYINKFFEAINTKLQDGGLVIGCVETKNMRKNRIFKKYFPGLNVIVYFFDYIVKRVFPKFKITKKLYFFLTRGQNRVLTKAETLGRLYSCGFEIIDEKKIDKLFYFVARKIKKPVYDPNPTYGPLVKLRRVGKNGKFIYVYKMRTMHPYSEYLQDYIYQKFSLKEGGKFKHDFRITTAGRIMRKFWIDELPMIINLLRGDMKIVGVRPLSKHYFSLYSKELQDKRTMTKPGLIPPFYVDNPKTLEEIQQSEIKYLERYLKHPFRTDISYFFKAFYNIIFRNRRSG